MSRRLKLNAILNKQARQDEAKWVRSPEECKARIAELQREIEALEIELEQEPIHP